MNDEVKIIPRAIPPWPFEAYAHIISPIAPEDGAVF